MGVKKKNVVPYQTFEPQTQPLGQSCGRKASPRTCRSSRLEPLLMSYHKRHISQNYWPHPVLAYKVTLLTRILNCGFVRNICNRIQWLRQEHWKYGDGWRQKYGHGWHQRIMHDTQKWVPQWFDRYIYHAMTRVFVRVDVNSSLAQRHTGTSAHWRLSAMLRQIAESVESKFSSSV